MHRPLLMTLISALAVTLLLVGTAANAAPAATLLLDEHNWSARGESAGAEYGKAAATAGDLNGDGIADLLVGAAKHGSQMEGAAFIYFGSPAGLSNSFGWMGIGELKSSAFGRAVAPAGDVNGDEVADVIIGAPKFKYNDEYQVGAVYVFYGDDVDHPNNDYDWRVTHNTLEFKGSEYGDAVAGAGDVNGDGFDDLLVGARAYSNGTSSQGAAFLYYGSADGPSSNPDWEFYGGQASAALGNAVSSVGDVNGDGYDDIAVGAPNYDLGETDEGAVFVFYGSETGLSAEPDLTLQGHRPEIAFGYSLNTAGDVNGDTYADLIVGAPQVDFETGVGGLAFAFYGSETGLSPSSNWYVECDQIKSRFAWSVGTVGDADGDGYDEIVVGAYLYNTDGEDADLSLEGAVFVYQGSATGLSTNPRWEAHEVKGYTTEYGIATGSAGDVNGDGLADLVVGVPSFKINSNDVVGQVLVYHGSEGDEKYTINLPLIVTH